MRGLGPRGAGSNPVSRTIFNITKRSLMDPERDRHLVKAFPILYQGRNKRAGVEPFDMFGFECGDGWATLLWNLSEELEWLNNTGTGEVVAVQVKEKFGGLRFYVDIVSEYVPFRDIVYDLIGVAETKSYRTCEVCGSPDATQRSDGRIRTLCNECEENRNKA